MRYFIRISAVIGVVSLLHACGRQDNTESGSSTDLSQDANVSRDSMQSNVQDVLESLGEDSSGSNLLLEDQDYALATEGLTRTCAAEGQTAKVTITSDLLRDVTVTGRVRTIKRSVSGKGEQVRVWSRSGASVDCAANGKHAKIDWTNVEGLALKISFSRSRSVSDTVTNTKKGTSVSRTSAFDASGTRNITWATGSSDSASTVVRNKTITSSVVRSLSVKKINGEQVDLKLTTEVLAADPLKVTVTRASSDLSLTSKLINSGTVIATNKDGGKVESSFTSLLINYKDGSCTPESGTVTSKFYAKDATTPSKTLVTSFENGVGTVTDESGVEVTTIEQNGCDPEDSAA